MIAIVRFALLLVLLFCASPAIAQNDASARRGWSDERLYLEACAACHGPGGGGQPRERVGFEVPIPDFRECSFATREPDADWYAVVHAGGPVRAFSELMPAFGGALTRDEIFATLRHVRTFCSDPRWPRGELNLPRPMFTEKAYLEDEVVFTTAVAAEGDGAVVNEIVYEQRVGPRGQFEVVFPFGWTESSADDWSGGVGDIALGYKHALYASLERGTIFSVTGEVVLPSGDEEAGLGGDTTIFEPFVTWGQLLPAELFVQAQAGLELPLESEREDEAFARLALGRSFNPNPFGRTWTPMVELLASRELVSGEDVLWDLAPQLQVTLSTRQHIMVNAAVRFPLDHTERDDTEVLVYLLWDWFDGGLFEGW